MIENFGYFCVGEGSEISIQIKEYESLESNRVEQMVETVQLW